MSIRLARGSLYLAALIAVIAIWQLTSGFYIPAKALLAQYLLDRAWETVQANGAEGEHMRPWPWADTWPVARLRIPGQGIEQVVLAGATGSSLAFGPGHLDGTPLPGTPGNSVIGGHRDTSLRFLQHLKQGDRVLIDKPAGATVAYRVTGTAIADARRPWPAPQPSQPMLTLVTCYPFDAVMPGGPLRYLVFAREEDGSPRL